METNTLLLRPIYPLRQKTTYAVVVTETLRGENGEPVRSPFAGVHHASDYTLVKPVAEWTDVESIAFAWSFTTCSITDIPVALREGMDGEGPIRVDRKGLSREWVSFQNLQVDDTPANRRTGSSLDSGR